MTIRAPWVLILLFPLFLGVSSSRPQLVGSRVLPLQAIVASEKYEYLLTTLEFDQDVYVNDPFVCAGQDQGCVKTGCEACDWSGEMVSLLFFFFSFFFSLSLFVFSFVNFFPQPTDCTNPNCCGPAQWPTYPSSNRLNEWCDSTFPPYTKLDFGVRSDDFVLAEGGLLSHFSMLPSSFFSFFFLLFFSFFSFYLFYSSSFRIQVFSVFHWRRALLSLGPFRSIHCVWRFLHNLLKFCCISKPDIPKHHRKWPTISCFEVFSFFFVVFFDPAQKHSQTGFPYLSIYPSDGIPEDFCLLFFKFCPIITTFF